MRARRAIHFAVGVGLVLGFSACSKPPMIKAADAVKATMIDVQTSSTPATRRTS